MRLATFGFVLFAGLEAQAQPGGAQQTAGAGLTHASFTATGLANEAVLTNLYLGNFAGIDLERTNVLFVALYNDYMRAYGRHCDAYLPKNKVELMETYCSQERYNIDRYGNRVPASSCLVYSTRGTGIYADPILNAAKEQLDNAAGPEMIHQAFAAMSGKNPLGTALSTFGATQAAAKDMDTLVRTNGCTSPGLKRFQENLMAYALNKSPVRLAGIGSAAPPTNKSSFDTLSKPQNLTKLLQDLILDQSRTWMMNRFVSGSVSNVSILSRDADGSPLRVAGSYLYNGQTRGSVTVSFSNGLPQCMYFFDSPSTCKTPSRRVADAYANGAYRQ